MKKYNHMAPAFRAIGYKEVIQYLQNFHDKDTMIQTIKKNTFDYAKRQMTWFKRFNNVQWVPNDSI
jgi:tRNA dimethylallyltransferase